MDIISDASREWAEKLGQAIKVKTISTDHKETDKEVRLKIKTYKTCQNVKYKIINHFLIDRQKIMLYLSCIHNSMVNSYSCTQLVFITPWLPPILVPGLYSLLHG